MPPTPPARWVGRAAALALALLLAAAPPARADAPRPKPKAKDDQVEATAGTPLAITDATLLANDEADDPATLAVVAVEPPKRGTVTRTASGQTTYRPPPGYTGKDEFRYTIRDGEGRTDRAKVRVDVVSAPPAFTSEPVRSAAADEPYRYDVTAADPDGDDLTFQIVTLPGWLSVDPGAPDDDAIALVGEPDDDDVGEHAVVIRVTDGEQTAEQAFIITVRDEDDAPTAGDDTAETDAGEPVVVNVLANDTGEGLRVVDVSDPPGGEATAVGGRRAVRYTPDAGFTGEDTFTYTVEDDDDRRATATVRVTVRPTNNAPTPDPDAATTPEGTPVTIDVLANDTDPDGDDLTLTAVTQPTSGASEALGGGAVRYTPSPGFVGTDQFTYTVSDGDQAATATVTVTVTEVNDAPTARADAYPATGGATLTVSAADGVLANDTDPDNDALTAALATDAANGTLALAADGSFTYTPDDGFSGTDSFTYRASDGALASDPATVTLTVSAANAPPVANDDTAEVLPGQSVRVDVLDNDGDPDNDALTVTGVSTPARGAAAVVEGGAAVRYTANAGASGSDAFTYTVSDGRGGTATATVAVTITPPASAPTAADDAFSPTEDQTFTAPPPGVLANDSDANDDALTAVLATDAANGALALRADGSFTYTPDPDFSGTDSFTYRASDGALTSDPATVTLTVAPVNDRPTAQPDVYSTAEDTPLVVDAPGVLANDTDPEGPLTAALEAGPENGTLALAADGSFTYTPDDDFAGTDGFTYRASDGALTTPPTAVTITVGGTNDAPTAADDAPTTPEDVAVTVDVLDNDSDPDDDDLTVLSVTQPANGAAEVTGGGAAVRYTSDPDFSGEDAFTYTVSDGNGGTDQATVTVTVTPVNDPPAFTSEPDTTATEGVRYAYTVTARDPDGDDLTFTAGPLPDWLSLTSGADPDDEAAVLAGTPGPDDLDDVVVTLRVSDGEADTTQTFTIAVTDVDDAPVATDDAASTDEDTPVTVDVLANDADPDGQPLTITAVSAPASGTAAVVERAVRYTPDPDFSGEDAFTYTVSDGTLTATATVTVAVAPVDDVPVARADVYVTAEDTPLTVDAPGVLANDVDPDSPLAAEPVSGPADGTLALRPDGSFTYTPDPDFVGRDAFTYRAVGGGAASEPAVVTVRVGGQNDAPVAVADEAVTNEDQAVAVAVLANDVDPDGDPLTVVSVAQPSNGTVAVSPDGTTVTYVPDPDFNGSDAFSYAASDGSGETSSAGVSVTVAPVNDAPVATDDVASTRAGEPVVVPVLANDRDVDGDVLAVTAASGAARGRVAVEGGAVRYTPDAGFVGTDAFTYTVSDGNGGAASAEVEVTVRPAAQGPAVTAETGPVRLGEPVAVTVSAGGFAPAQADLFYRPAGGGPYLSVPLVREGGAGYTGTIPASAVTVRGVDYYVVLAGDGVRATSPAADPAQRPRHLRVAIPSLRADVAFGADGLRMVALPVDAQPATPAAVFVDDLGPYDPTRWRLFRWDPEADEYDEFPDVAPLEPGRGVWLAARAGATFDVTDALSTDASGPVSFALPPGWSQIGTPFGFPVDWADVEGSDLVSPPVGWDGREYRFDEEVLRPWAGYFVENATEAPVTITVPARAASTAARRAGRAGPAGYRLRLGVTSEAGGHVDTQNVAAFDAGAAPGRDRFDRAEPPPPGPHVRLSLLAGGDRLAWSVQPDGGAGAAWDAEVAATPDLLAAPLALRVALEDEAPLPAGYGRYVLDLDGGAALAVEGGAVGVTLSAADPVRRLRVIVGTEAFAASVADGVPLAPVPLAPVAFGLERAAPNPVGRETALAFSVPAAGPVVLDVVDLLGRRVAVVVDGERDVGRHTVRWRPDGLASGTYVVRLRAGGEVSTRTVTVVR